MYMLTGNDLLVYCSNFIAMSLPLSVYVVVESKVVVEEYVICAC